MMPQPETEVQKKARHATDNYSPEFVKDVARLEKFAQDAGYEQIPNSKKKTLGVVTLFITDLKKLGVISSKLACIIKKGKKDKNVHFSHGVDEIMAVSKNEFKEMHDAVEIIDDISKNGFTIYLDNNTKK